MDRASDIKEQVPTTVTSATGFTSDRYQQHQPHAGAEVGPSTGELIATILRLQEQQEKSQKFIQELILERQRRIDPDEMKSPRRSDISNPHRSTMYMANTPQRVDDRTSMGGVTEYGEHEDNDYVADSNSRVVL
jgi:hypothetical protein